LDDEITQYDTNNKKRLINAEKINIKNEVLISETRNDREEKYNVSDKINEILGK